MRSAITVCHLDSIPIDVHASWPPVFLFVTWTLAARFFPLIHPRWAPLGDWAISLLSSSLLFGSLLAHELGHVMVARRRDMAVCRVSLFFLGGMAEIAVDEGTPADEFWMALAGPAVSALLSVGCLGVWIGCAIIAPSLTAVALYLGMSNVLLAAFNLLPVYPLDGGRILRSALWAISGDLDRATRYSGWCGQALAATVVAGGLVGLTFDHVVTGAWLIAVGAFLFFAARGAIPISLVSSS